MYQYSVTMLHQLSLLGPEEVSPDGFLLLTSGERFGAPELEQVSLWRQEPLDPPTAKGWTYRLAKKLIRPGSVRDFLGRRTERYRSTTAGKRGDRAATRKWLSGLGVNRMLFCTPDPRSFEIDLPYMMPVHDLQHRLQPHFPEVVEGGELERREYLYTNAARTAQVLLADSDVGREDLLELYGSEGLTEDRVVVLPFLPPPFLRAAEPQTLDPGSRMKTLPREFLFYPAQFWPHKNHERLIAALGELQRRGFDIPLVLCGSNSGPLRTATFRSAMDLARSLNVIDQVLYLGYVDDKEMPWLYRSASALVFATFFGPTNIPIVEAWLHDCPVLTSDIRGIREQAGDAALLVSPDSVEALATGIQRICVDEELRARLVEQGRTMLRRYTPGEYSARLQNALSLLKDRS